MSEFLEIRGALEAPIPDDISFLYAAVRSAFCFDVLRFRDCGTPALRTRSYQEAVPDYKHELQRFIDSALAGNEYEGALPVGAIMGPDFIEEFVANLSSIGYSQYQQKAYLQRLFKEIENSSDSTILLQSRSFGGGYYEISDRGLSYREIEEKDKELAS